MKLWEKTALILALASIATQLIGSYLQVSKKLLTKILLGVAAFAILAFSILITVDVISKRETTESTNRETATPSAAATATVTVAPIEKMSTPTVPAYQPSPVLPTQTPDLVENRQEFSRPATPTPIPLPTQNIHLPRGHYCLRYRNDTDTDLTIVVIGESGEMQETIVPSEGKYRFWQQPTSVWFRFQFAGNGRLSDRKVWNPAAKSFSRSYPDLTEEEKNSIPLYRFIVNPQGYVQLVPE